jgi:hypothetical protein
LLEIGDRVGEKRLKAATERRMLGARERKRL